MTKCEINSVFAHFHNDRTWHQMNQSSLAHAGSTIGSLCVRFCSTLIAPAPSYMKSTPTATERSLASFPLFSKVLCVAESCYGQNFSSQPFQPIGERFRPPKVFMIWSCLTNLAYTVRIVLNHSPAFALRAWPLFRFSYCWQQTACSCEYLHLLVVSTGTRSCKNWQRRFAWVWNSLRASSKFPWRVSEWPRRVVRSQVQSSTSSVCSSETNAVVHQKKTVANAKHVIIALVAVLSWNMTPRQWVKVHWVKQTSEPSAPGEKQASKCV